MRSCSVCLEQPCLSSEYAMRHCIHWYRCGTRDSRCCSCNALRRMLDRPSMSMSAMGCVVMVFTDCISPSSPAHRPSRYTTYVLLPLSSASSKSYKLMGAGMGTCTTCLALTRLSHLSLQLPHDDESTIFMLCRRERFLALCCSRRVVGREDERVMVLMILCALKDSMELRRIEEWARMLSDKSS